MNFTLQSEEENKHNEQLEQQWMRKHNFHAWYDVLCDETFESISLDLDKNEGLALCVMYKNKMNRNTDDKQWIDVNKTIGNLKTKIKATLQGSSFDHGYFVRLSSRSPKDAVMDDPYLSKTQNMMYQDLKYKLTQESQIYHNNLNTATISYFQSCLQCMECLDGSDMINLLSSSLRIHEDLQLFKCQGLKLIIRKWSEITLGSEFRGFINKNGVLNGLSQYYHFLYFECVKRNKDKIQNAVLSYYNKRIKHMLLNHHYLLPCVIDFVILNFNEFVGHNIYGEEAVIKVVELNIFHDYSNAVRIESGSEMFDWTNDKNVLLNGPFEFRIREELPGDEWMEQYIASDWNNIHQIQQQVIDDINKRTERCCIL
eukprot:107344_1